MQLFPFGTFPQEKPQWFVDAVASAGLDPAVIPVWFIGEPTDFSVPGATKLDMPAGYTLCRHGHPCGRFEVVVRGALEIGDGRVARAGDTFTADPYTMYGPHTAGPEGCTTIEIFSEIGGMFRMLYEGPDGEILEANILEGELPPDYQLREGVQYTPQALANRLKS